MKSNDLSNKLRQRFKRSKDFDKLIQRLEKEHYKIYIKGFTKKLTNEEQFKEYGFNISMLIFEIVVFKDKNRLLNILFENNRNIESEYKQNIVAIYY